MIDLDQNTEPKVGAKLQKDRSFISGKFENMLPLMNEDEVLKILDM